MDLKPENKNIKTIFKYDTEYSADSVEWCPHEPHQNVFVCANYQIKESENESACERLGRILLFSITAENGLQLHQQLDTAAVLDQKWCLNKINNFSLLGVVNAKSTLEIYKLNNNLKLELVFCIKIKNNDEKESLLLSLDWSTNKLCSDEPQIVVSDSRGNLHLFTLKNEEILLDETWHGHEYEAWIAGFNCWDPNIIFSGGDDSLFLKFDKRTGLDNPIATNRTHDAGVTSFHSNLSQEYVVASGSYDSNVRIWDLRKMKAPQTTIKMPDTLWRIKFDPFTQQYLLAACMRGGIHIIDSRTAQIFDSYYEHENICYGADWCHLTDEKISKNFNANVILATCSFYDHLLCVSGCKL